MELSTAFASAAGLWTGLFAVAAGTRFCLLLGSLCTLQFFARFCPLCGKTFKLRSSTHVSSCLHCSACSDFDFSPKACGDLLFAQMLQLTRSHWRTQSTGCVLASRMCVLLASLSAIPLCTFAHDLASLRFTSLQVLEVVWILHANGDWLISLAIFTTKVNSVSVFNDFSKIQ